MISLASLLQRTLPDAVYSRYSGSFDSDSLNSYVSAVLCGDAVRVRILDLYACDSIELDSQSLVEDMERLDTFSKHDHMDMICIQPEFVSALLPLINHANEACKHRVGFVTDPSRIDEYRPGACEESANGDPGARDDVKGRLAETMARAKALGIDVDDDVEPEPAAEPPSFEQEMASAPPAVAKSYAKICDVLGSNTDWPGDQHYNLVLEECVGESAISATFLPSLLAMVKTGQLTGYLGPLFTELLEKQTTPEAANQALLKISRILLLYTQVVPERVRQYAA